MHRARSSAPPRSTPIRSDLRPLEVKPQGGISRVDLKNISQQQSQSRLQRPDGTTCQFRADYSVQMVPHVNVQRLVLMQQHPQKKNAILVKLLVCRVASEEEVLGSPQV
ncbi:unnamed protein product [Heterosigma akashiwo]